MYSTDILVVRKINFLNMTILKISHLITFNYIKMENLFAGIDSSTQGTKIIVIDFDQKKIVYTDSVNYDKDLPQYQTQNGVIKTNQLGVSESDPKMWIEAIEGTAKQN